MSPSNKTRRVIAIAAPIGGGKSELVHALAQALGEQAILAFDDYESATQMSGEALSQWLTKGADFNQLRAPGLAEDLTTLRAGGSIKSRHSDALLSCHCNVFFEMPLGRAWAATADAIDVLIWVDTPLDIALARRVSEIAADLKNQPAANIQNGLAWLQQYLANYTKTVHAVLEAQKRVVRPQADLVLNGLADISTKVQEALRFLGHSA